METKTYHAKSVIIGRKPRTEGCTFKTAFVKLYDSVDPFSDEFPTNEIDIPNIEKVVFFAHPTEYYLEGNDLVYKNIARVIVTIKEHVVEIDVE